MAAKGVAVERENLETDESTLEPVKRCCREVAQRCFRFQEQT